MQRRAEPIVAVGSEQRFEALLESAPDAIVIVDEEGRIVIANGEAERLFGYTRQELVGQPVEVLVPDRLRDAHRAHRRGYMADPHTRPMGMGLDLAGRRRDGSEFPVEISLSPLVTEEGTLVTSVVRDIGERKRAERALRESEQRFREFVEGTDDLVTRVDAEGRLIYVNHTAERIFGLPPEDCVGLSAFELVHPEDREETERAFRRWIDERVRGATFENRQLSRSGAVHRLLWTVNPRYDEAGRPTSVTSIGRDITARERLEQAERERLEAELQLEAERTEARLRREVLRRSIEAQEEERRRIAHGLHDDIGQALTAIILGLGRVEAAKELGAARDEASHLGEQAVEALRDLRGIAMGLRPTALDDFGLIPALERLVEDSPAATTAQIVLDHSALRRRLDPALDTVIYRVVQEALTNAARHAEARRIAVELRESGELVTVDVRDDGKGFDPAARAGEGLGLAGMRERAELVGGRLEIESAPESGTRVTLAVPVAEEQ